MNNKIQEKINLLKQKTKNVKQEWFDRFFSMLYQCNVDEKYANSVLDMGLDSKCEFTYGRFSKDLLSKHKGYNANDPFFGYMQNLANAKGQEYIKNFLEKSIKQMEKDFEIHKNEEHFEKTNITNLFLRQLVKENPQDVKLEASGEKMKDINPDSDYGYIEAVLGGVTLGHICFEEKNSNHKTIVFSEFRIVPGLEKLGLGSYIFTEFCKQLIENKQDYSALAWNVMKGHDGEKVYSAWGAYPIIGSLNTQSLDTTALSKEQYDAIEAKNSMLFYFSNDVVKKNAEKKSKYYSNDNEKESE